MRLEVLDYGYVELIEAWGAGSATDPDTERGIIEAARQSTQGSFRGWDQDANLLKYLYEHNHATPFEFAGMVIEVQAPIFVFREWHRHRTQSYNEMSARYAPLPNLYYHPTSERIKHNDKANKQAASVNSRALDDTDTACFRGDLACVYKMCEEVYQDALSRGIPKELARLVMPVGHYSKMRASANLRNWLSFLALRCDPAAQWEIRQYANAVSELVSKSFPHTHMLWSASRAD